MVFDHLVKLCSDLYTAEEINVARDLLAKLVAKKRLIKPKGSAEDVAVKSISDMLKVCPDPSVNLSTFCAIDLHRLPPVKHSVRFRLVI